MDLDNELKKWQEILRITNWDITAEILQPAEYVHKINNGTNGWCETWNHHQRAKITIKADSEDLLHTLVHELVHIVLNPLNSMIEQCISMAPGTPAKDLLDGNREYELEKAVNMVTRALINANKQGLGG